VTDPDTRGSSPRLAAMNYLARREHSLAELRTKLKTKGFSDDEAADTVTGLAGEGLVSDERFVEAFLASRRRMGKGPLRIRHELERRGVSDELIADHLHVNDKDWIDLANRVREKKFGDSPASDIRERARQSRFLQYRGFTGDQIRAAMTTSS
jgi:regulatory protein